MGILNFRPLFVVLIQYNGAKCSSKMASQFRDAKVAEKSGFPDFSSQLKIFPDFLFMTHGVK